MPTLVEVLGAGPARDSLVSDCVGLVDAQVKGKGFVLKAAYATIKTFKRRFVPEVINALLDDWLGKLQPHHDRWAAARQSRFADHLISRSDDVAEDLLSVTDARAARSSHGTVKNQYLKHRATAKANVVEAIPELARLIERHLDAHAARATTAGAAASPPVSA